MLKAKSSYSLKMHAKHASLPSYGTEHIHGYRSQVSDMTMFNDF